MLTFIVYYRYVTKVLRPGTAHWSPIAIFRYYEDAVTFIKHYENSSAYQIRVI